MLVLARGPLPAFALGLQRRPTVCYFFGSYLRFVFVDGIFRLGVLVN